MHTPSLRAEHVTPDPRGPPGGASQTEWTWSWNDFSFQLCHRPAAATWKSFCPPEFEFLHKKSKEAGLADYFEPGFAMSSRTYVGGGQEGLGAQYILPGPSTASARPDKTPTSKRSNKTSVQNCQEAFQALTH